MSVLKATVRGGRIELDAPEDWPEGTEVRVEAVSITPTTGLRDEDWPETPEAIARHLAAMDRIEPWDITAEEGAEWEAARDAQKAFEKTRFDEHAEAIRKDWE